MTAAAVVGTDVLVVGDANPDLLLTGDTVARFGQAEQMLDAADLVLGGSAAITACGLARLGLSTALAARTGTDEFGDFVHTALGDRGVDTRYVTRTDEVPTGLSVILVQPDDRAILTLSGTIALLDAETVLAAVDELRPRHVHISSWFLQPGLATQLPDVLGVLRTRGVTTSLDTNWDPAERWAGLGEALALVDVLLPNREEALALARAASGQEPASLTEAGVQLSGTGCRVVVKDGAAGAVSFDAGRELARVPGRPVRVVDTTGAGDSFNAGYLTALLSGVTDETERLTWAVTAGSLSVRGRGGTATQATRDDLTSR